MVDQRRWEELDMDCLVNVFGRVGMESLLLDVPFVCKSWYKASLNPSCWKQLVFPDFEPEDSGFGFEDVNDIDYPIYDRFVSEYRVDKNRFSETEFIKFIVNRSCGKAIAIKLSGFCKAEGFEYVAHVCHDVVVLGLAKFLLYEININLELIGKWENLLVLSLGCSENLEKILAVVSTHCKYFFRLSVACANIGKDEALAIVNLVPKLKWLSLSGAGIDRDNLVILLQGCKDLKFLDVRNCIGFDEGDEEISQLASNISQFMCEGSKKSLEFVLFDDLLTEDYVNDLVSMLAEFGGEEEGED